MTSDDRFEEALGAMAREHHRAPGVPREEMWAVIARAREEARRQSAAAAAPAAPVVLPMRRPRTIWKWGGAAAALAAAMLIGIVIGRGTQPESITDVAVTGVPAAVQHAPSVDARPPESPAAAASAEGTEPTGPIKTPGRPVERSAQATIAGAEKRNARAESGTRTPQDATLPYRVAAMEHLVTTEALLVSLRSDVRAGRSDTTIATWAGNLLGTTRMLKESPASEDPQLKQLLDDLELVLAQIARLPGARGEAADLGLIDDAVQRRQIMTRLRAMTPTT